MIQYSCELNKTLECKVMDSQRLEDFKETYFRVIDLITQFRDLTEEEVDEIEKAARILQKIYRKHLTNC